MKNNLKAEIVIGRVKGESYGYKQSLEVTLDIELKDQRNGLELTISGNVWNKRKTDVVSCGQNYDELLEHLNKNEFKTLNVVHVNDLYSLITIWKRWHLNGMNAGCEHQRNLLRTKKANFPDHSYTELIKFQDFKKCSECGYAYGSAWKYEELPEAVIQFVQDFIKTGKKRRIQKHV